ncbi:MAG: META domain-containing protein [Bacteroidetes bacterium]|nr:META domain-containing protein [Bacteroidota bacterium]
MKYIAGICLFIAACGNPKPNEEVTLTGNATQESLKHKHFEWSHWSVKSRQDSVPFPNGKPSLDMGDSGRMGGYTGCNQFTGKYSMKDGSITIKITGQTKMFCLHVAETELIDHAGKVNRYKFAGNSLTLYTPGGDSSVWLEKSRN